MVAVPFAFAALVAGVRLEDVVAGSVAVFVGISLLALGRPPFADTRIPTVSSVVAWTLVAIVAAALAVLGVTFGFAMLALAASASAGVLGRRRSEAKRRGLV
jgi:hypothetical protein